MKIHFDKNLLIDIGELQEPEAPGAVYMLNKLRAEWSKSQQELKWALEKYHTNFDPKLLEESLAAFGQKVSSMYAKRSGYLKVKVKPGKTDSSRQVYLKLWAVEKVDPMWGAGRYGFVAPTDPTKRWVFVPTTLLHSVGEDLYLPDWFLQKKLIELQKNSTHKFVGWKYIVKDEIVWLGAAAYQDFLRNQLPADLVQHCEKLRQERLATDEARRREEKARLASIEQERTNEPARLAAEKANSEKTKAKALAKLNTLLGWASVNVRYQEWTKTRGSISSIERTADDVTVRQSGARAYIIFSDGTSIFKPTKCVTVFDQTGNPLAFLD